MSYPNKEEMLEGLVDQIQRARFDGRVSPVVADAALLSLDWLYGTNFASYYFVENDECENEI